MNTRLLDILDFWFSQENCSKWFVKNRDFDQEILLKFYSLYMQAKARQISCDEYSSKEILAMIILFDQFPRNMFRGQAEAFATDDKALILDKNGIKNFLDRELPNEQRSFFYMPFMHSENLQDQVLSLKLFSFDSKAQEFANAHFEIIKRFGRFPHRNAALKRESTPQELEFLNQPGSSF